MWELPITLASFSLEATRSILEAFFSEVGDLQKGDSQVCELLLKLAMVDERPNEAQRG